MTDISRRGFIIAGGTLAGAWLAADAANLLASGEHAARSVRAARDGALPPLQYLTQAQAADLDAATAQVVPSDDLPGAHEAGVVYFIDKSLATWAADQRDGFKQGLDELHARAAKLQSTNGSTQQGTSAARFASLSVEQQRDVIESLVNDKHPFFFALKGATMTGMLANPEWGGNVDKAGWKMIGFDDRFSWAPPFGWYDAHA